MESCSVSYLSLLLVGEDREERPGVYTALNWEKGLFFFLRRAKNEVKVQSLVEVEVGFKRRGEGWKREEEEAIEEKRDEIQKGIQNLKK